jgi:hypothetical protein
MAFADPVALVVTHLEPLLAPVAVVSRVPNPRPPTFAQVRRVGGTPLTVRDQARLDVFTWAPTEPEAMALALDIRSKLWALAGKTVGGVPVYRVDEFMGVRQEDDAKTGTPKTWATYSLTIRADDAIHLAPT